MSIHVGSLWPCHTARFLPLHCPLITSETHWSSRGMARFCTQKTGWSRHQLTKFVPQRPCQIGGWQSSFQEIDCFKWEAKFFRPMKKWNGSRLCIQKWQRFRCGKPIPNGCPPMALSFDPGKIFRLLVTYACCLNPLVALVFCCLNPHILSAKLFGYSKISTWNPSSRRWSSIDPILKFRGCSSAVFLGKVPTSSAEFFPRGPSFGGTRAVLRRAPPPAPPVVQEWVVDVDG